MFDGEIFCHVVSPYFSQIKSSSMGVICFSTDNVERIEIATTSI